MLFSRETPLAKRVKHFVRTPIAKIAKIAKMHRNLTTTSISTHILSRILNILSRDHWVVAVQEPAVKKMTRLK